MCCESMHSIGVYESAGRSGGEQPRFLLEIDWRALLGASEAIAGRSLAVRLLSVGTCAVCCDGVAEGFHSFEGVFQTEVYFWGGLAMPRF